MRPCWAHNTKPALVSRQGCQAGRNGNIVPGGARQMRHWHGQAGWKIREQAERLGDDAHVEPKAKRVEHGVRHGRSSVADDPAAVKQGVAEGIVALPADVADAV